MAALCLTTFATTACSPGPSAPDSISGSALSTGLTRSEVASKDVLTFPVLGGSFTFTLSNGDSLTGIYTGEASVSNPGSDIAVLNFIVTGGSGVFEGASASFTASGRGAFSGEGDFTLSVKAVISTTARPDLPFSATVRGDAVASCANQRIALTLQGDGSAPRLGPVMGTLHHEVGNTSCFP